MSRPQIAALTALFAFALLLVAPPAEAQSNLANCKYYTKVQQDFRQGIFYCEPCIQDEPENPEARFFGAWCLAEVGRWDEAWESFEWLLVRRKHKDKKVRKHAKFAKERVQAYFIEHFNAGVEKLNAGDNPGAREEFEIASKIDPRRKEGFLNLGFTLSQAENYEDAIPAFKRAIGLAPDEAIGYDYLSVALDRRRQQLMSEDRPDTVQIDELTELYRATLAKVLEFNPESDAALLQLGDLALADGEIDRGIELLVRSVRIAPENVAQLYNVGVRFYERDEYEAAVKTFELVTQELNDPNDQLWRDSMFNLALAQLALKDFDACTETMESLKLANPNEPDYYRILARAYSGAGNQQLASENLMRYDELLQERGGR